MILRKTSLLLVAAVLTASCHESHGRADSGATRIAPGTLAVVDGRPISSYDVHASIRTGGQHGSVAESEADALNRIIQEDIVAEHAVELGLDSDADFQQQDRAALAAYHAFRRTQLVALFGRHQVAVGGGAVTDADARAFYTQNAARIRAESHVLQLMFRVEGAANQALADLQTTPFEDLARRSFPDLPETQHPWDLGFLPWTAIPDQWHPTIDQMAPGTNSGVIPGPNHRFWILRLVERRDRPDMTFEAARQSIVQQLTTERAMDLRTHEAQELRARAHVVYIAAPPSAPAAPHANEEP
jgi:hypothetical protein